MGFWQRLFNRSTPAPKDDEHALLLHIKLESTFPNEQEQARYFELQEVLTKAIEEAGVGMLDGDEWGGGECLIFMYGPDADRLWDAVAPNLETLPFPKGSHAIKRYGGPDCGREERISIEWAG